MRVSNIGSNVHFGHKIIIDIGASNPKGTCKVLVKSDDGRDLSKTNGYLNNTVNGFSTKDETGKKIDGGQSDFISKLDDVIFNAHRDVLRLAREGKIKFAQDTKGGTKKDSMLSGVAVFVPGTTFTMCKDDKIAFIPNLRNDEGESLVNIDFKKYEEEIKTGGPRAKGLDPTKGFELVVTKDLGGAGLALAKVLAKRDELKIGDYVMGVMTGGGFGSVDVKVKGSEEAPVVEFETSESSSYLSGNTQMHSKISSTINELFSHENPKAEFQRIKDEIGLDEFFPILGKLGRQGVSVKSHLNCFLRALELDATEEEYANVMKLAQKAGDARLVTSDKMHVSASDEELCEELKACRFFKEVESNDPEKRIFSMNRDVVSDEKIDKARIEAVHDYANAVSLISINKINDCINKVYLVGPFAQGLNKDIKRAPDYYGAADLPSLIMQKINTNIDPQHVDLPSTKRLMELYNFEIICDPQVNFPDNTFAGDMLLDRKLQFTPNRGSWFQIPLKTLQESK